jgi:hypothetical protein
MPHATADGFGAAVFVAIQSETNAPEAAVRAFLDSRHGQHFADGLQYGLFDTQIGPDIRAIAAQEVARWQGWSIDRQTERMFGIPHGWPYLTGWVEYYSVIKDDQTGAA